MKEEQEAAAPVAPVARYGVLEQAEARDDLDVRIEELRLLGFTVLDAGLSVETLEALSARFDEARQAYLEHCALLGFDLEALDEHHVIRVMPRWAGEFLEVVFHARLHELLRRVLGEYFILNQVNGLINPAHEGAYSQHPYHRDLPFRHLTTSRPLALNAIFTMDEFTRDNGATWVLPGSHRTEAFPSDQAIGCLARQVEVPRGCFVIVDCLTFHAGGLNRTARDRRAVNHVFTIPAMRQQLHLPSVLQDLPELDEDRRKVLGFGLCEYSSHGEWFEARQQKQRER